MNQGKKGGKVFSVKQDSNDIVAAIHSDGATRHFGCAFLCCDSPVCTCNVVHIDFTPLEDAGRNSPDSPYQVSLDVSLRQLAFKDEKKVSKENAAFANLLLSSMDKDDFNFLWKLHFAEKNQKTEQAPIESIEADFDYQEIEQEGLMYFYRDVLPYGDVLVGRFEGQEYILFDQYCLKTKCSCTDAYLTFAQNVEELDQSSKNLLTVAVNYRKKKWSLFDTQATFGDLEAVKAAIEDQIPDLYKQLLKRHIKLKKIYAHCKQRHFNERINAPKTSLQLPKVGRNDPCPCGSGKKYKKCCL